MTSLESNQGFLLVARPELADPNFRRTVILIISHDRNGSLGLVLNRPLDRSLSDVLPDPDPRCAKVPLLQGGPVQRDMVQFVGRQVPCGRDIVSGVAVGAHLEELLDAAADGSHIHAYAGYAGWGQGQLERETEEGSWIICPAAARHVFEIEAERLWSTVLRELGGRYAWLSLERGSPAEN